MRCATWVFGPILKSGKLCSRRKPSRSQKARPRAFSSRHRNQEPSGVASPCDARQVVEESAAEAHSPAVLVKQQQPDIGIVSLGITEGKVGNRNEFAAWPEHAKFLRCREIHAWRAIGEELFHHRIRRFRAGFQHDEIGGAIVQVAHGRIAAARHEQPDFRVCHQGMCFRWSARRTWRVAEWKFNRNGTQTDSRRVPYLITLRSSLSIGEHGARRLRQSRPAQAREADQSSPNCRRRSYESLLPAFP